tara:strand:- start:259 stop:762 length:504 start_codon:yes stop_codon:yes gene_type:complete
VKKKEKNFLMMLKKLLLTFSVIFLYFLGTNISNADLINPKSSIKPREVVEIQLTGLMNNNEKFEDSGIEQTWNFAHPENKKNTGPLPNFKRMIKGRSYQMLINHVSHSITEVGSSDKWAQFEVVILDQEKIYHKFNWQVEKYNVDGPLKDCWLTTMVSSPIPLGSSI